MSDQRAGQQPSAEARETERTFELGRLHGLAEAEDAFTGAQAYAKPEWNAWVCEIAKELERLRIKASGVDYIQILVNERAGPPVSPLRERVEETIKELNHVANHEVTKPLNIHIEALQICMTHQADLLAAALKDGE